MCYYKEIQNRAKALAKFSTIQQAIKAKEIQGQTCLSAAEALILGLLNQGVRTYVGIFGHGLTHLGEILRIYENAGACKVIPVRHETEASHSATALRWVTKEKAAVFTSIGPGAMQAFAGSLVPASNSLGIWYIYGDETTQDEGPNMQQIPKSEQSLFLRMFQTMNQAYSLHTPEALPTALRRGQNTVDHPWNPGPFFLLFPMNIQPYMMANFNLQELPEPSCFPLPNFAPDQENIAKAISAILESERITVKVGGGGKSAGKILTEFIDSIHAVLVHTPVATGVIPASHPGNMGVGGSKGSICGNYAMEEADLLITVGTRYVCQSDSSRTGYPKVQNVISIHPELEMANHYGKNIPLLGTAEATLSLLCTRLKAAQTNSEKRLAWRQDCLAKKQEWLAFKNQRYQNPILFDPVWKRDVLTQPAAIYTALEWAKKSGAITFFDAGDVQANGFQIAMDEAPGKTFTETGASYMGFAVSALLANALASKPFFGLAITGDGSFTMNPQILIDGASLGIKSCILLLDNRRMGAISSLQQAQYAAEFATWDLHPVDYVAMASCVSGVLGIHGGFTVESLQASLEKAYSHSGLSLIHVPVYYGSDPLGGLGAFGRWNIGNWVESTQKMRHDIGL